MTTKTLQELAFFPVYNAPATVISINDARVSAEVTGILTDIPIKVGDHVQANAITAQLDCRDHTFAVGQAKALLKAARAEMEFAHFQFDRAKALLKTKAVSEEMLNERQAQAKKADAEVERLATALKIAELHVEKCTIRAPFKAVVIERIASVGEFMTPGTEVVHLLDRENLEVTGNIQEQDLEPLQRAQSIRFVNGKRNYPLKVRTIIPLVETKLRSYKVRFSFTDKKAAPGEAGRVKWESANRHLPSELLVRRENTLGIFFIDQGKAKFHVIHDAREGQPAALDLPGTAQIIVDGRFGLTDGDVVQVVSP